MKEHTIYDSCKTCEENEFWLDDERANLSKTLKNDIIAIADVGRWNGRFSGYKVLGNNLNEVLGFFNCDDITVVYDGKDIRSTAYHHDSYHKILFREIKPNVDIDILLNKIYDNDFTDSDIEEYTTSLGKYVEKIYGWS